MKNSKNFQLSKGLKELNFKPLISQIMFMNSTCPKAKKEPYQQKKFLKRLKDQNNPRKYQETLVSKELSKKFITTAKILTLLLRFSLVPILIFGKYFFLVLKKLPMRTGSSCCMPSSQVTILSKLLKLDSLLQFITVI